MRVFTVEEFNIMVDELSRGDSRFEMLCRIAEKTLRPSVFIWCRSDMALAGRGLEEDIMQEIYIRLITTCMTHFFRREGFDGEFNNDPDGFNSWMFKVAFNIKRDFAKRERRRNFFLRGFEEDEEQHIADASADVFNTSDTSDRLGEAFAAVLNSDAKIYKVLTWLASGLFIISRGLPKHKTSAAIVEEFSLKTLYEMRDILFDSARMFPWIVITAEQDAKITRALNAPYDETRVYGQVRYKEFFMKKDGKATISDWVNRMNGTVRRVMANEPLNN